MIDREHFVADDFEAEECEFSARRASEREFVLSSREKPFGELRKRCRAAEAASRHSIAHRRHVALAEKERLQELHPIHRNIERDIV